MLKVEPAQDLQALRPNAQIWSIAMMLSELATFKGTDKLITIHELNIDQGYNHIVIEVPELTDPVVISRTSSVEGIVAISQEDFLEATVMDLIYALSALIANMTDWRKQ